MAGKKFYVTTAIDYVNAKPHIGHAFEKILADAIARWHRLKGENVWFLTGTDENAQKNAIAAKKAGIPVKEFVDENAGSFIKMCKKLNISNDDFVRTTEERHIKLAQEIFKKIYDKGDIYKGKYEGLYCEGCEAFITEKDLVNGKCPEHNAEPKFTSEEAYFFRLSRYKDKITKFVQDYIVPEQRKNEIIARLNAEELKDLCVSRTNLDWGIDNPIDKKFKIYVWIDALVNYLTGSGEKHEFWPADLHVIGKGINWFHSVIWPAILLSAGYELPKKLLVHGYMNVKGQKMSKSLGNAVNPIKLAEKYSVDSLRYFLLKSSVFDDSEYSEEILVERHNNELANKLGNLVLRVTALAEEYGIKKSPNKLIKKLKFDEIEKHMENYELDKALSLIFEFVDVCNEYVQREKPWKTGDKKIIYELLNNIQAIAFLLYPFIPETAEKIAKDLGFEIISFKSMTKPLEEKKIKKPKILFQKIKNGNNKNR